MKYLYLLMLVLIALSHTANAQAPDTLWTKMLGGTSYDYAYSIQQTHDSGYIVAGKTLSNDGDVSGYHGSVDYWIVKLDMNGDTNWTKCLGGTAKDIAYSIVQTNDSGYIVTGQTGSCDGDITGNHGGYDFWVVRLNSNSDILWQECFGGTEYEISYSIQQTNDSGYIIAGSASSTDGDVHGNHGLDDFWIVKLSDKGDTLWTKSFGGPHNDIARSIRQTFDSGYIVAGYTYSFGGDVSGNHGSSDYWVIKLDSEGDTIWTKTLGGSNTDQAYAVRQTFDSGYIIAGYTYSNDGDVHGNRGSRDYWLVKLNNNGDTLWSKTYGGYEGDEAFAVQQTQDSGFVVAGLSTSTDGDVEGNHGGSDYWIVKLDNDGQKDWAKCLGGSGYEGAYAIQQSYNLGYAITGYAKSTDGDVYGNHGASDFWVVSLEEDTDSCPACTTPFVEDFTADILPDCWSMTATPGWQFSTGADDGAAEAGDHTPGGGTNYAWIEPFNPESSLLTPAIDVSSLISPSILFWYFCNKTNDGDGSWFKVEFWDGTAWNLLFFEAIDSPNWQHMLFDLSGFSISGDVQFRFTPFWSPGNPGNGDILIDDILVDEYPSCPPVDIMGEYITENRVNLVWTETGSATSWKIMLDTAGFDTASFLPISTSNNHFVQSNLVEDAFYDWYVRSECDSGDFSEWVGPQTFLFKSKPWLLMQNTFGGSLNENAKSIQQTFDGGYIVAGYTISNDYDVIGNHGSSDYWIVKLNSNGNTDWTKAYGGSGSDYAYSVQQTYDSGYILAGGTFSSDDEVHGNHGGYDFWIVKTDDNGDTLWTKTYGGSNTDELYSVQCTYDSGYILAGYTSSYDGDVHGNHGGKDFYIVKTDGIGDTLWTKCLGGSGDEEANSVQQTYDSGFIVAGYTWSTDGDVHGNHGGNSDFWVVKLNNNGATLWARCFGGSLNENAKSIQQTYDSGYIVAGHTGSVDGDVHGNHGAYDYWVVKLTASGDTLWTKTYGGIRYEHAYSIQQTRDSGYIVSGIANSWDGDVHGNHGNYDYWVVKLNAIGDTLWTKTLGGLDDDEAFSIQQTIDNKYVVAGYTSSNDGDVFGNHGVTDFWVVELAEFPSHIYQSIPLLSGWNILSFNVTPNDPNMLHIVHPLIDSSELVKVMDEAGGIIQNIPGVGWMNTIGDMANTEGYYTKVNASTQLQTTGLPVTLPYTIPLTTGWNIMGYPLQQSQDALTAVQPLIDDDELIKVLDESGGFIQDIPGIGWMNTIGDFEAGEGYYIKVANNTSLTLDNLPVLFIGSPPIVQKQPQLFSVPKANPYLPMNIIVTGINIEGYTLQSGDEVAVFDNNRLAGAGVITTGNKVLTHFAAAMDDPLTTVIDGYIEGNIPAFRFKSTNLNGSIQLRAKPVFGDLKFSPLETLVCTLEGNITAIEEQPEKTFALKCVPNPANNYTNIQYQLPEEGQLQLEVYDLSSHRIKILQNEQQSAGSQHYRFDVALLERGIYLVKIQLRTKDNQFTEVVKFVKN